MGRQRSDRPGQAPDPAGLPGRLVEGIGDGLILLDFLGILQVRRHVLNQVDLDRLGAWPEPAMIMSSRFPAVERVLKRELPPSATFGATMFNLELNLCP